MLKWAAVFFVIALMLGVLGFGGLAGAFMSIAKLLFWLAVAIFALFLVLGLIGWRRLTR